ncbi:HlyD family secretion protein [Loktanella sp. SALINAS62]|uniref:HlyD family efflux transporter periplasmic adaptor subunit n=1 Tax=Loktanella sp. SALINAS62 TaxID=2706124 RepID=UPI001B8BE02F|nr:HlyD family secretion protein [Loktanella sp. SALINAS62]MBS1302950.1 HlyD family efflux transporter periplasmic adaptor subunit [Loktanella sp. SALINAS62]
MSTRRTASHCESKWKRAFVGAAGILVEIALAAIAMIVWANAEEGLVRAFALNIMLIGGVSTLLFNGNPLLRFDGYYVLCDLIEIPNLGQRANKYLGYLVQRYAFGIKWAESPVTARGERGWFVVYAIAAYFYRLFITFAIVSLVATRFFIIGIVLAIWAVFLMLLLPVLKMGWFLLSSPVLRRKRGRALGLTVATIGGIAGVLLFVPVPHNTLAQGVVFPRPEAFVNAASSGVIRAVLVKSGDTVAAGTPLVEIDDPLLASQRRVLEARLSELDRRLDAQRSIDPVASKIIKEERDAGIAEIALMDQRVDALILRADTPGRVVLTNEADLIGRYVEAGQLIAVVADFNDPLIRIAVPEARAELVRRETRGLSVRFAQDTEHVYPATVSRAAASLSRELPSLALSEEGGGPILLDPASPPQGRRALEGVYQMELRLTEPQTVTAYGDRVHVRFSHDTSPLAARLYRSAAQVFLRVFAPIV